jgi:hypothetical protein
MNFRKENAAMFLEVVKCFGFFFGGIILSEWYNARMRKSYNSGKRGEGHVVRR